MRPATASTLHTTELVAFRATRAFRRRSLFDWSISRLRVGWINVAGRGISTASAKPADEDCPHPTKRIEGIAFTARNKNVALGFVEAVLGHPFRNESMGTKCLLDLFGRHLTCLQIDSLARQANITLPPVCVSVRMEV